MQFRQQSDISLARGRFLPLAVLAVLFYGPIAQSSAAPPQQVILSPADLGGWQEQTFVGQTLYRAEDGGPGSENGGRALHATADGTASGLCHSVEIDLKTLPVVRWNWRLDRSPQRSDERGRPGEDQGLRLSFLHRGGTTVGSILAIQYVWSQNEAVGATWANAFVPNAHEVVARSGPALPGTWKAEQRDLKADFRTAFGQDIDRVDAVCIMTDGDQTGALVEGWYGDIILQAR
jgi:hypothetical protein